METAEEKFTQPNVDPNYVFEAEPKKVDVEAETEKIADELSFDPEKLAGALIIIGQKMLGVDLYDYQIEPLYRIICSLLIGDGAEITLLFARQSGKSEVVAAAAVILGVFLPVLGRYFKELSHFKNGVKMGVFAPQLDQVDTVYSRCLERIWADTTRQYLSDPDIQDKPVLHAQFYLKSGSYLKAQSGAKQSKVESKTYHIVFIDESQDMDTGKVRKSIIPMLAATFGTCVRLGTTNRYKGDFFYTIHNNKLHDRKLPEKKRRSQRLHFEYDWKEVIKAKHKQFKKDGKRFHELYQKSVERDRKSMGENSEEFRMSYCLEWLHEVGMFISEKTLEEKVFNHRITFPSIKEDSYVVAGLDIASARASTILTLGLVDQPAQEEFERPRKVVAGWLELAGMDYESQFDVLAEYLMKHKVSVLYGDYTGVGRGLMDRFMYHYSEVITIVPYMFTADSKSVMWKTYDEDIINGRFIVPAHKAVMALPEFNSFVEQHLNLQKFWKGSILICEKTYGFKDDYCDSGALMNLAGNHMVQSISEIQVSNNDFYRSKEDAALFEDSKW